MNKRQSPGARQARVELTRTIFEAQDNGDERTELLAQLLVIHTPAEDEDTEDEDTEDEDED